MRKATRKSYHKQVKYINRRKNIIKKQKMARTFLNSDKREYWRDISRIRGRSKRVVTTVEGRTEKYDIAECFSPHCKVLFNSVHYDEEEMSQLYRDVCSETSEYKDQSDRIAPQY